MITITNKTILDAFMTPKKWHQDHLHNKLIKGEIQADTKQDLKIMLDDSVYWATTTFKLNRLNDLGEFYITVAFDVRKDSKYSETIYTLKQDLKIEGF